MSVSISATPSPASLLKSVQRPTSVLIAQYRYDSQNRRVSKTVFSKDSKAAPRVDVLLVAGPDSCPARSMREGLVTTQYLYLKEGGPRAGRTGNADCEA